MKMYTSGWRLTRGMSSLCTAREEKVLHFFYVKVFFCRTLHLHVSSKINDTCNTAYYHALSVCDLCSS